jgi:hypothetical protein
MVKSRGKEGSNENDYSSGRRQEGEITEKPPLAGHTAAATRQQQLRKSPNELDESTSRLPRLIYRKTSTVM